MCSKPAPEWFEGEQLNWQPIPSSPMKSPIPKFDILRINSDPKVIKTFQFADRLEFWRKMLKEAAANTLKSDKMAKTEL